MSPILKSTIAPNEKINKLLLPPKSYLYIPSTKPIIDNINPNKNVFVITGMDDLGIDFCFESVRIWIPIARHNEIMLKKFMKLISSTKPRRINSIPIEKKLITSFLERSLSMICN
jgi:hypothetical protein